jgi:hypothetical protein
VTALAFLGIVFLRMKRNRATFMESIPLGYGAALIGAGTFILGGLGDMAWHELFGIEADVEALVSPTHLILAVSMFLMVSANVRAWFHTIPPIGRPSFVDQLPMLFSVSGIFCILSFMMQFSHYAILRPGGAGPADEIVANMSQNIAITGILFHTAIFMGCILFIARRARLAAGAITFIFVSHILAMAWMLDAYMLIPAAVITGIVADVLLARAYPFERHRNKFRAFSFVVPIVFFSGYFLTLQQALGIWWTVHLWTGSIVLAGLTGLLVSYLVLPPREWEK